DDDAQDEGDDDDQDEGDDDDPDKGNDNDQDTDDEGDELIHLKLTIHEEEKTKDEESFDPIVQTPKKSNDEGNDDANLGLNVGSEEGHDELYRDVNINLKGKYVQMTDVHTTQEFKDTHVTLTLVNLDGQQQSSLVSSQFVTSMLNPSPDTFAGAVSSILGIIQRYMDQQMNEEVKAAIQIQSDRLQDEAQAENEEFLKNINENIQKIIKGQVKKQVKAQVSKILPNIEKTVNEQLAAEVLTRSSNSSKTSYAVVADLSEMELKKILIEKMESNKSIHRSDEQRNLHKALVEAYESDKIILETYGDIVTLKIRRDDDTDKDEEPSAGSDQGSKKRREGKDPYDSTPAKEPMHTTQYLEEPSDQEFETDTLTLELLVGPTYELIKGSCKSLVELEFFLEEVYKATTSQLDQNNPERQQYPHNLLKPLPRIPNSRGRRVIPFDHFINNDLEYLRGGASNCKYTTCVTKTKATDYGHIKWIEDLVPRTMWSQEMDDRLKGIQMKYLPQAIWRNSDKERAASNDPGY
nr:hypothetical protein [Tanacetum cinerariifolium]